MALQTLNSEMKEVKEKLGEAGHQKETLQEKLSTLREEMEKAGADAVTKFKASQSFIDSCAEYYDTGFEDCLKQVTLFFTDLDLSGITMDAPIPLTPTGNVVVDESDDSIEPDLPSKDDGVVLAQLAANPPVTTSNPSIELLDVENPFAQDNKAQNDASAI